MKLVFATVMLISIFSICKAQVDPGFIDTIQKRFDYNQLELYQCSDLPKGIYSLTFIVDSNNRITHYTFIPDTLIVLKKIMVEHVEKVRLSGLKFMPNQYILPIHFNAVLACIDTSIKEPDTNIEKSIIKALAQSLASLQTSFKKNLPTGNFFILPVWVIDDTYLRKNNISDFPDLQHKSLGNKKREEIEEKIKKLKKQKEKS